jgi:hypothetical protein
MPQPKFNLSGIGMVLQVRPGLLVQLVQLVQLVRQEQTAMDMGHLITKLATLAQEAELFSSSIAITSIRVSPILR